MHDVITAQEFARCGSGGVVAALTTHGIGLPPVLVGGHPAVRARVSGEVCSGEKLIALAITEPGAGSDVAAITTTATVLQTGGFLLNGVKVPCTSGVRADYVTVAARTLVGGVDKGISLFLVPSATPGVTITGPIQKMGWWAADAAMLTFEDVKVHDFKL